MTAAGDTAPLPIDAWERFVAMLPAEARSIAKSTKNTAALAEAARRAWTAVALVEFVCAGLGDATNPAAQVAARLSIASQRNPVKPPARAEVVKPPRARAPSMGACAGNGRDTTGCGHTTTVRTSSGRHCCPEHL